MGTNQTISSQNSSSWILLIQASAISTLSHTYYAWSYPDIYPFYNCSHQRHVCLHLHRVFGVNQSDLLSPKPNWRNPHNLSYISEYKVKFPIKSSHIKLMPLSMDKLVHNFWSLIILYRSQKLSFWNSIISSSTQFNIFNSYGKFMVAT